MPHRLNFIAENIKNLKDKRPSEKSKMMNSPKSQRGSMKDTFINGLVNKGSGGHDFGYQKKNNQYLQMMKE
jgi:hypothetical protein